MSETLYLQISQNNEIDKREVTLGDIASILCADNSITAKVKAIKLVNIPDVKKRRISFSVLYVIKLINDVCPNVTVDNIGECDFIIDYIKEKKQSKLLEWLEILLVCIITFIGSMYAIMAYNNDVGTLEIFEKVYTLFNAEAYAEYNLLEIAYAIGIALGIIVFYNHFRVKKEANDPTPVQVEMDKYEKDINTSMIDRSAKSKKEVNVK